MLDDAGHLDPAWVAGRERIGVTAGASAPEILVRQVVQRLLELGAVTVEEVSGITEDVTFPLPRALASA
jgi:4-hydroxy-3-methylbut-2-enyl diphosphate reductase